MAQFSVEIADADVDRVLLAIAKNYGRPETIIVEGVGEDPTQEIENPETLAQFANRIVRNFLSENVRAYEIREAKRLAAEQAQQNAQVGISDPQLLP